MIEKNYYKTTEAILYNLVFLTANIDGAEKELANMEQELKGMYIELYDYERDAGVVASIGFTHGINKVTEKKILRKERLRNEIIPSKEKDIDKKLEQINRDKTRLENIRKAIDNLGTVNPRSKQIIELFYISKRKMSDICGEVYLEEAQVHREKSKGIKAIKNQLFGFDALEEDYNLISMLEL